MSKHRYVKNTLITFFTQGLNFVFALVVSILIARTLGPEGKGVYSLAILLPVLLVTFFDIGIGPATVFHLGKNKYSPKKVFGVDIVFSGILSSFCVLIGLFVIFFGGEKIFPGVKQTYLLIALLIIPFRFFSGFITDILLAKHRIKKYNLISVIQHSSYLFLIITLIASIKLNIITLIFAEIFSFVIACVFLFYWTIKVTQGIDFNLDKKIFKDFIYYGLPIYIMIIAWFLHLRIDMIILNKFLLPAAVGIYSISVGLAEKIWMIAQSAGSMLFPKVSSASEEEIKNFTPLVSRNVLFLTFLISGFLFIIGPKLIILLYSDQFRDSGTPFRILLIGTVMLAGDKIISSDFWGKGILKPKVITSISSVALNIALNFLLIPKFGINGAAMSTAISYSVLFLADFLVYIKISKNRIRDTLIMKKSDLRYYKSFLFELKNKLTKNTK